MPCALCLLGFEMYPVLECVASHSPAFETPLHLQPCLGFHHEIFFLPLSPLPTHCRCTGLLLHVITLKQTTLGRSSLKEGSARRRDLYLTTYNTHKRQTSIALMGFEPVPPASERPQTYALDRAAIHDLFLMFKCFRMEQIKANCKKKRVSCH
jgi:hypothetical protein